MLVIASTNVNNWDLIVKWCHYLSVIWFDLFLGSYCTVTTVGDLSVLEGQSVTVPCHYNPQYISHVKYWCYGRMKDFCSSLARTDDPTSAPNVKGRVTIADDPPSMCSPWACRTWRRGIRGGTGVGWSSEGCGLLTALPPFISASFKVS